MMGTFGGALEARQIDASDGKLTADVTGEVEQEDGVLVIRRIHVSMHLVAPEGACGFVAARVVCMPINWHVAFHSSGGRSFRNARYSAKSYATFIPPPITRGEG